MTRQVFAKPAANLLVAVQTKTMPSSRVCRCQWQNMLLVHGSSIGRMCETVTFTEANAYGGAVQLSNCQIICSRSYLPLRALLNYITQNDTSLTSLRQSINLYVRQ